MTSTDTPTTYGTRDGFDYRSTAEPVTAPDVFVVAFGMAHYRGPDGHLWYAIGGGRGGRGGRGGFDWAGGQNVADFDRFDGGTDAGMVTAARALCPVVDAARAAVAARADHSTSRG